MSELTPILIPLVNPNEPEAVLTAVYIQDQQLIQAGDLVCTLETTKSTIDVAAESDGFVVGLLGSVGQTMRAGQVLCYLAHSPDVKPNTPTENAAHDQTQPDLPASLRITQPALSLAQSLGFDIHQLPLGPLITESNIRQFFQESSVQTALESIQAIIEDFDPSALLIYGGGGHGKSLIDLVRSLNVYHLAGIIDDGIESNTIILGIPVLGNGDLLLALHQQGMRLALNAVGGIGNLAIRLQVAKRLARAGFVSPTVSHPSAVIESSADIAAGVQIFAHTYIGSETRVDTGAIINTGVIVSHECSIGAYANLSPGATLAGQVVIGPGVLVGMGVTINLQVKIGENARIGNSATIKSDVPANAIIRAGSIWPT